MTTRLDRLLLLLSTGSTQIVRHTAAKQLGHIAAQCIARPSTSTAGAHADTYRGLDGQWSDVINLLVKVLPFLRSKQWETRTAAAVAIEAIVKAAGIWEPPDYVVEAADPYTSTSTATAPSALASLDISEIIIHTDQLLASSGAEYSGAGQGSHGKKELVKSLGLSVPGAGDDELGIDVEEELRDGAQQQQQQESSIAPTTNIKGKGKSTSPALNDVNEQSDEIDLSKLSARERNAIKRKRKLAGNGSSVGHAPPPMKSRKVEGIDQSASSSRTSTPSLNNDIKVKQEELDGSTPHDTVIIAYKGSQGGQASIKDAEQDKAIWIPGPEEWPFLQVVASMQENLLSTDWEIRHGAALGIREILKVQGRAAGSVAGLSRWENAQQHRDWADDLAASLITVLARDRFGDFVGDQVVAPVRETAAQTLSALIVNMPKSSVLEVYSHLTAMVRQDKVKEALESQAKLDPASRQGKRNYYWEVKHAGLLGLKYLAAVHRDLFSDLDQQDGNAKREKGNVAIPKGPALVKDVLSTAILGLGDRDDDVRSVAASLLLPITPNIVDSAGSAGVLELLDMIYSSLNDLRDDLSSSVGNVMDLLSNLLTYPQILGQLQSAGHDRSLQTLVPRLFPFFRHTIVGVRKAVVDAMCTFLSLPQGIQEEWLDSRLLRLLYQNLIVEQDPDVRRATLTAWDSAVRCLSDTALNSMIEPHIAGWFDILMTPIGQAMNAAYFWKPSEYDSNASGTYNVDKAMVKQDLALVSVESVVQCRLAGTVALSALLSRSDYRMEAIYGQLVKAYLTSTSSHQISFANFLIGSGFAESRPSNLTQTPLGLLAELRDIVLRGLNSDPAVSYSETAGLISQIHIQCQQLYGIAKNKGKLPANMIPMLNPLHQGFSLARAQQIINDEVPVLQKAMKPQNRSLAKALMDELSARIAAEVVRTAAIKDSMDIQVFAALAGATVALQQIPNKLNPLIRSLMNGIKFEMNIDLQARTAEVLASFLVLCRERAATLKANPSDKIVKNVCSFLCQDQTLTPLFTVWKSTSKTILLHNDLLAPLQPPVPQARKLVRSNGVSGLEESETEDQSKTRIVRRGAELCLKSMSQRFGDSLFQQVPMLWQSASLALVTATKDGLEGFNSLCATKDTVSQEVMDSLTVLDALVAQVPAKLEAEVAQLIDSVLVALQSQFAVIRYVAVRCMSTFCNVLTQESMKIVVTSVLSFIADPKAVSRRRGGIQLLADIVDRLDIRILPYIIFLVVPVLGRMTDPDEEVRILATRTFALMIKLVPLEVSLGRNNTNPFKHKLMAAFGQADIPDPVGFPEDLLQKRQTERRFLSQLLGGGKVEEYQLPIKLSVDLRKYQRDGVSWLAFLAQYQLHGILCDDMGLGKTLQTICILGSKTLERAQAHAMNKSPATVHLPSLVVCPPTLTNHWRHEIHQYAPDLTCTIYGGDRQERLQRVGTLSRYDIVVMSYDVVRNDIDALGRLSWHYCVLDEGHIIKNGKTKLSKAIKTLQANHRLILSGTPIQNNVLELWNLFDFLMPGFLGTEESFNRRYGKPIQQSRDAKSSSKDQEAGALALDALHKQVLPFVLRRLKEDVLDDLPPKIIQDYYCDLSPLQRDLYENYAKAGVDAESEDKLHDDEEASLPKASGDNQTTHVFQTLQYLRRLVNHPTLVIRPEQESHNRILAKHGFKDENDRNLRDIAQAPKLMALKQLLLDNGIGTQGVKAESDEAASLHAGEGDAVAPHRVLIFCQLKNMLDLIQNSLFAEHMPSVSYLRLDGSTPPHKRHDVVQTFNADPSIDVLLLTTHVGGLGLNLTGADTVIFVEHDWNPMRDLQAMDRAHRLGQKRVVNVYRLITRGTLEEKIMGLQRFKMNIASTVVSQQNSDISDMGTDNVLDLFSGAADQQDGKGTSDASGTAKKQGRMSQKEILQSLQELDDPSDDYKDLGDASRFADTLNA